LRRRKPGKRAAPPHADEIDGADEGSAVAAASMLAKFV
jgi:hypothetical protein